jgi:hypothetical protein
MEIAVELRVVLCQLIYYKRERRDSGVFPESTKTFFGVEKQQHPVCVPCFIRYTKNGLLCQKNLEAENWGQKPGFKLSRSVAAV